MHLSDLPFLGLCNGVRFDPAQRAHDHAAPPHGPVGAGPRGKCPGVAHRRRSPVGDLGSRWSLSLGASFAFDTLPAYMRCLHVMLATSDVFPKLCSITPMLLHVTYCSLWQHVNNFLFPECLGGIHHGRIFNVCPAASMFPYDGRPLAPTETLSSTPPSCLPCLLGMGLFHCPSPALSRCLCGQRAACFACVGFLASGIFAAPPAYMVRLCSQALFSG